MFMFMFVIRDSLFDFDIIQIGLPRGPRPAATTGPFAGEAVALSHGCSCGVAAWRPMAMPDLHSTSAIAIAILSTKHP